MMKLHKVIKVKSMISRTLYNGNSLLTEDAHEKGLASTAYKDTDERVVFNAARATSIGIAQIICQDLAAKCHHQVKRCSF